jgi:hypothetical protein
MRGIKRGTSADETTNPTAHAMAPQNRNVFSTLSGKTGTPNAAPGSGADKKKVGRG